MRSKSYTFKYDDGPLLCYQVGDQDWVAAQNPEQALAVLAQHNGDWLHENTEDYDVVITGDSELDQQWQDEDAPGVPTGCLRQWLAEAKEPCWLIGTE